MLFSEYASSVLKKIKHRRLSFVRGYRRTDWWLFRAGPAG
ncbi:Unknown protein sequence [Pseudomonas syringae pv. maculicola]|nr:Unknown protein sequence [Pseudomonas syringae pv. maculicola]